MTSGNQFDNRTYHLVISRKDGRELLLLPSGRKYHLPSLEVPPRERLGKYLTDVARTCWGCDLICLFSPDAAVPAGDSNGVLYHVMECYADEKTQSEGRAEWVTLSQLSPDSFTQPADHQAVRQSISQWETYSHGVAPGPFARPGWFGELRTRAEQAIRDIGHELKRDFQQVNASPTYSLIRLETSGPAVWFKAVGKPNLREFSITFAVAQVAPQFVPQILAALPEWNGWLVIEASGTSLGKTENSTENLEQWIAAATTLAELQIVALENRDHLLDSGAHDLRSSSLLRALPPLLNHMMVLMEQQKKSSPPALNADEIAVLREQLDIAVSVTEMLGVPDSIGHLDLNPANVIVSSCSCTFLDWSEAYVGNPFLSFEYLREHFRRMHGADPAQESELREAYVRPWRRRLPSEAISNALAVAPLLAVSAYAVAVAREANLDGLANTNDAYLRSLTRRMKREADQLKTGRVPCRG